MKTLAHTDLLKSELYIKEKDLLDNEQHEQGKRTKRRNDKNFAL